MNSFSPLATALPVCPAPAPVVAEGAMVEMHASLQWFSNAMLLWQPDSFQLLVLYADGTLCPFAGTTMQALGEALAPAENTRLRLQRRPRETLLWTERTGWLRLHAQRWELCLG